MTEIPIPTSIGEDTGWTQISFVAGTPSVGFNHPLFSFDDLVVEIWTQAAGTFVFTRGVHYDVSGTPGLDGVYGSVLVTFLLPPPTSLMTLYRKTSLLRSSNFPQTGYFDRNALNADLNREVVAQQDQRRWIESALRFPEKNYGSVADLELPDWEKSFASVVGFDSSGNPTFYPVDSLGGGSAGGPAGGDLRGSYPNPELINNQIGTEVTAGSSTAVARITADDKGRVQGLVEVPIAFLIIPSTLPPDGPAGGDLAGNYPNPTIKASVALTGNPTAPTPPTIDDDTSIATSAFVKAAIAAAAPVAGYGMVWREAALTITGNNTYQKILWDGTAGTGGGAFYNPATGELTPPSGVYHIDVEVQVTPTGNDKQAQIALFKNGVLVRESAAQFNRPVLFSVPLICDVEANGTDKFDVQVKGDSNMAVSVGNDQNWFAMFSITGSKGPTGDQGPPGTPGVPGAATGPAGGDLEGTYPDPVIKASVALSGFPTVSDSVLGNDQRIINRAYVAAALVAYAPLASPVFTGTPTAPTPAPGDSDTSIATTAFVASALANATPVGAVIAFAGSAAPSGWLLLDGATVSRTLYAGLFSVLGVTYGAGDGSTTFALPDARGRTVFGADNMGGVSANRLGNNASVGGIAGAAARGATGGAQTHAQTVAELAAHAHSFPMSLISLEGGAGFGQPGGTYPFTQVTGTNSTGSGTPSNITPPALVLNYIIKH